MARKSQEELEAPAKVYQFEEIRVSLEDVKKSIDKLTLKADNQVTLRQFEERLLAITTAYNDKLANMKEEHDRELTLLRAEMVKIQSNMSRFTWIVIGVGVTIVGSAVSIIYFTQGGA